MYTENIVTHRHTYQDTKLQDYITIGLQILHSPNPYCACNSAEVCLNDIYIVFIEWCLLAAHMINC